MSDSTTVYHQSLAERVLSIAGAAAGQYLGRHGLTYDETALRAALTDEVKAAMPQAVADARQALACGMQEWADRTFAASFVLAGIAAAKKVGARKP